MKYLEKSREDFKINFKNLKKMRVPHWIVTLFDFKIENADIESHIDELVHIYVDLEA